MIPFARILNYGNVIVPPQPLGFDMCMQSQYNLEYYLHNNGDLYSAGNNSLGQLGQGSSTGTINQWAKVLTDVERYWIGIHGAIAIKNDKSIWYTGSYSAFPPLGGTVNHTSFKNVTTYFTNSAILADNIKLICITDSVKILTKDGRLAYCGANGGRQLGTGNGLSVNTLTFNTTLSGITDMSSSSNSTTLLLSTGQALVSGVYRDSPTTSATLSVFTSIVSTGVKYVTSAYAALYFFMNDGTVVVNGTNTVGQLGTGNTTAVGPTGLSLFTYDPTLPIKFAGSVTNSEGTSPIIAQNGSYWRCGSNGFGQAGIGSTASPVTTFTSTNLSNIGSILYFSTDNNRYFAIDKNFRLYTCGNVVVGGIPNASVLTYAGAQPWNN